LTGLKKYNHLEETQKQKVTFMAALFIIALLTFVYMVYVLIKPEKF